MNTDSLKRYFDGMKAFQRRKKRMRDNYVKAYIFYFRNLFRKTINSAKIYKEVCTKQFWFTILLNQLIKTKVQQERKIEGLIGCRKIRKGKIFVRKLRENLRNKSLCKEIKKRYYVKCKSKYFRIVVQRYIQILLGKKVQIIRKNRFFKKLKPYTLQKKQLTKLSIIIRLAHSKNIQYTHYQKWSRAYQNKKYLRVFKRKRVVKAFNELIQNCKQKISLKNNIIYLFRKKQLLIKGFKGIFINKVNQIRIKMFKLKIKKKCFNRWKILKQKNQLKHQLNLLGLSLRQNYYNRLKQNILQTWAIQTHQKILHREQYYEARKFFEHKLRTNLLLKYFSQLKHFFSIMRIQKVYNICILKKAFVRLEFNKKRNQQVKLKYQLIKIKGQESLRRKYFHLFKQVFKTRITSGQRIILKKYLDQWIKTIVQKQIFKIIQADRFYMIHSKLKVLYCLKETIRNHRQVELILKKQNTLTLFLIKKRVGIIFKRRRVNCYLKKRERYIKRKILFKVWLNWKTYRKIKK